jgi:DsbC/DsbD-like thiol-disulfide interchange protein
MGNVAAMNMISSTAFAATLALSGLIAAPALAEALSQDDIIAARLLPGWQAADGTRIVALHLDLADGWKTYWRAPGDTGIPPLFDWAGSTNLKSVRVLWPRPEVFLVNGMQSIGYKHEVVLPIVLTTQTPGAPISLRTGIDLGVCRDICVPARLDLSLDLPDAGTHDQTIAAAIGAQPVQGAAAGLAAIRCTVAPISDGLRLTAEIDIPATGGDETTVFELPGRDVWVAEATTRRDGGRLTATTELVGPAGAPFALDRGAVVVTILGRNRAVEIRGCPAG